MKKYKRIFLSIISIVGLCLWAYAAPKSKQDVKQVVNYVCSDGWTYTGQMLNGKRHGEGTAVTKKGNEYSGHWVNNGLNEGMLHTVSNAVESFYEGGFNSKFEPHGFGVMKYVSGRDAGCTYIGNFVDGYKSGIGKMVKPNGEIDFGLWRYGALKKPAKQKFKPGDKVYGIDLSHHNVNVEWDRLTLYANNLGDVYKLKPRTKEFLQPVSFAYLRATLGADQQDSLYRSHAEQARRHRIPVGSYHFLCFTTSTVEDQVANFLKFSNNCSDDDLPPMLDVESVQAKDAGPEQVREMVDKWLKMVEKATGRRPIIYTNCKFANDYLDMSRFDGYTIWLASYGQRKDPAKKEPSLPWDIWQFTCRAHSGGITPVDVNFIDMTIEEFNDKYLQK